MKIHLPNSAFLGNIDAFFRSFNSADPGKLEITANKKWISVHPVVLTMIGALGLSLSKKNVTCEALEAKSRHYFERMRLFGFLGIKSGIVVTEHESAGRFIPLTRIGDSQGLTNFLQEMVPLLHLDPSHAESIRYIISELVRNVIEHARTSHGALVAAQYYKKSNSIKIGIADVGVGIKHTIRESYPAKTDLEAIHLALMPGVTGTTKREGGTELNAGAGLFFIKSIASVNRNFFMIYSGNAMYKLLKSKSKRVVLHANPFDDRHTAREDFPFWQGTLVGVDISLDEASEFTSLLDLIKETYAKAVKERRKERYRTPKFI